MLSATLKLMQLTPTEQFIVEVHTYLVQHCRTIEATFAEDIEEWARISNLELRPKFVDYLNSLPENNSDHTQVELKMLADLASPLPHYE